MFGEKIGLDVLERLMVAVTFAEAGEWKTALDVLHEKSVKRNQKRKRPRVESRTGNRPVLRA